MIKKWLVGILIAECLYCAALAGGFRLPKVLAQDAAPDAAPAPADTTAPAADTTAPPADTTAPDTSADSAPADTPDQTVSPDLPTDTTPPPDETAPTDSSAEQPVDQNTSEVNTNPEASEQTAAPSDEVQAPAAAGEAASQPDQTETPSSPADQTQAQTQAENPSANQTQEGAATEALVNVDALTQSDPTSAAVNQEQEDKSHIEENTLASAQTSEEKETLLVNYANEKVDDIEQAVQQNDYATTNFVTQRLTDQIDGFLTNLENVSADERGQFESKIEKFSASAEAQLRTQQLVVPEGLEQDLEIVRGRLLSITPEQ